ncbi:MAG: 50S ribosomal protein L6 [Planctomycetes bacterium]|nr:50S ribosomal protein L6 [Planctomycetota bacterium]
MSRIGKQPVKFPKGVEIKLDAGSLSVKGPKGTLIQKVDARIKVDIDAKDSVVNFSRANDDRVDRAMHGLYRALCRNMVEGVTTGYAKRLEIHGVGYQAKIEKGALSLSVGFSNPVVLPIPKGITIETPNPTTVDVKGIDRQQVGEFSARIRGSRPPEPYQGKGIRYAGEQIRRKAGKSMATGK